MTIKLKIKDIKDELDLYLTSNKLKPASIIRLDVYLEFEEKYNIIDSKDAKNIEDKNLSELELKIDEFFKKHNVFYYNHSNYEAERFKETKYKGAHYCMMFYIAKNLNSLEGY
ncbi:MAG: hypothetical protein ACP5OZ_02915 [Candidatus Woesearchaeota archaeon]